MTNAQTPICLLALISALFTTSTAFPIHFPPSTFTNATLVLQDQISALTTASSITPLQWNEETGSPSILLCQKPHSAGECLLLEDNIAQTCLNLESKAGATGGQYLAGGTGSVGLEVRSLRIGGGGGGGVACVLFGAPACTGESMLYAPEDNNGDDDDDDGEVAIHDLRTSGFKGKVMSLFCEPTPIFSSWDPDQAVDVDVTHQGTSGRRRGEGGLWGGNDEKKASRRSRRHTKRLSDSMTDPYPESQPRKTALLLNPWKPESGRALSASSICGDGLFYAAAGAGGAGGCINPAAHVRAVEVGGGLGDVEVDG